MIPITIFKLSLAYLIPTLIGFVILSGLEKGKRKLGGAEKLALSFALGSGIVSFYLFYLGILRIHFNFWTLTAIIWPFLIWGIYILGKHGGNKLIHFFSPQISSSKQKWEKALIIFLFALLLWKAFFACSNIINIPTYFDDSVSFWNYKAKVYYEQRQVILDRKHPDFLGGSHPYYPNGIPLFKSWVALWIGEWKEYPVNLDTLIFWICLGLLFYSNLRRYLTTSVAFVFTYMLLSVPLLTFHAGFAYLDMVIGFYFLGGIIYLYCWIEKGEGFYFVLSALLFSVGLSIKEEMVPLFFAGVLPVLVIYQAATKLRWSVIIKNIAFYLSIALIPNFPWFFAKAHYGLQMGLGPKYLRAEFHPEAFKLFASFFFDSGNYNILWTLFIAVLVISFPLAMRSNLKYLLLFLILAMAVSLGAFTFTALFEFLINGMTINRTMLTIIPLMIFYSALAYHGLIKTPKPIDFKSKS